MQQKNQGHSTLRPPRGAIAFALAALVVLAPVGAVAADSAAELRLASRSDGLASALPERAEPRTAAALTGRHRTGPQPIGRFQPLLPSRDPADALVDPTSLTGGARN